MTGVNPEGQARRIVALEEEVRRLTELVRSENVTARALADANDAKISAEDRAEAAVSRLNEVQNEYSAQVVNLELALEDVVETLSGVTGMTDVQKARDTAQAALRAQKART